MKICDRHGVWFGLSERCPYCDKDLTRGEKVAKVDRDLGESSNRFSFSTVERFDHHVSHSIRGYAELHQMVVDLSEWFIESDGKIYDIGCSTGTLARKLKSNLGSRCPEIIGIEPEENFYRNLADEPGIRYIKAEAGEGLRFPRACLIISLFVLQFSGRKVRGSILRNAAESLGSGGAMIVAEKVRAGSSLGQDILTFAYYDFKRENFTPEEILTKERDLRRLLRPLTAEENERQFREAGFSIIEPFWQSYAFRAWLLIV